MAHLLIYGAGAIGRGYVPWLFDETISLSYVEANPQLRAQLQAQKEVTLYMATREGYRSKALHPAHVFAPGEELPILSQIDGIITAVGPRQVMELKDLFEKMTVPVLLFENDSSLAPALRHLTGNPHIYFGVPDVITSNTAPAEFLAKDPLALVTEDGTCYAEDGAKALSGSIHYVSQAELNRQWIAKLYLHNTPHCIAAYLGALQHKTYLHEGMVDPRNYVTVEGAMREMAQVIETRFQIDPTFIKWYANKEISRFCNEHLSDPIVRVAREPFRKLEHNNRLIGAAQLALSCGIVPIHCITGIIAAIFYTNEDDPDYNIGILRKALSPEDFLKVILRLSPDEALFRLVVEHWPRITASLKEISYAGTL